LRYNLLILQLSLRIPVISTDEREKNPIRKEPTHVGGYENMHAKVLDIIIYESQWEHRSEQVALPTWERIEDAIRQLDKFHFPILHLWPTLDESMHELTEDREWFSVIGGDGEYWFAATIADQWENHYLNKTGSDQRINLWTSDQGFSAADREVCRDVNIVLQAARYYAENGGFDPSIPWSTQPTDSPSTN
jgi:hypothetical protein